MERRYVVPKLLCIQGLGCLIQAGSHIALLSVMVIGALLHLIATG